MFGRFLGRYAPEGAIGCSGEELLAFIDPLPVGFPDLVIRFAGATFGDGQYRLYEPSEISKWTGVAIVAFPNLDGRIVCFGMNWLGFQFALDVQRDEGGEPLIMMLDPGAGEAVEIPATFVGFHEEILLAHADAILGSDLFEDWCAEGQSPPSAGSCAGCRVPLFLGGADDVSNLELMDAEEYWDRSARSRATGVSPAGFLGDAQIA
jgi:hypothetical protein